MALPSISGLWHQYNNRFRSAFISNSYPFTLLLSYFKISQLHLYAIFVIEFITLSCKGDSLQSKFPLWISLKENVCAWVEVDTVLGFKLFMTVTKGRDKGIQKELQQAAKIHGDISW